MERSGEVGLLYEGTLLECLVISGEVNSSSGITVWACSAIFSEVGCRFITYQDARRVGLTDGLILEVETIILRVSSINEVG